MRTLENSHRYATTKQLLSQEKGNFKMVGKIGSISTFLSAHEGLKDGSWYSQCETLVHGSGVNGANLYLKELIFVSFDLAGD